MSSLKVHRGFRAEDDDDDDDAAAADNDGYGDGVDAGDDDSDDGCLRCTSFLSVS